MKIISWIHWFFFACICLSEAKNKIKRPLIPPYPPSALILKKFRPFNRPISHRISMGNTIHIDNSHQRIPYINHRIHRPMMYNILSTNWKNQIPIRAFLNKHIVLPQQVPAKEFNSIHQISEYKPERKSELVVLPSIHQGIIDDDKGPIHTIPAPNLSSVDKFHNLATNTETLQLMRNNPSYSNPMLIDLELATVNKNLSQQLRRIATSSISPQHQYEVTESNDMALKEHQSVQLSQTQQDLNITELSSSLINPRQQLNGFFSNHLVNSNPSIPKPNVEFIQPMQTNLHSSLYVGFPSTVIRIPYVEQQIPDLHVDHSTPAESFLSATQLYEFSNNFPSKFVEQYMSDQQQILQQQLDQSQKPNAESFSQPQMHSFNYNEANKLQQQELQTQQKISFDQDYVSEDIIGNYNLDSREKKKQSLVNIPERNDNVEANKKLMYSANEIEQSGNNIEYEEINYQKNPIRYFDRNVDPTKFYTILPNRETAEKLAALAAAGNINSRLIGQLRKQQQNNVQEDLIPFNHKNIGDDDINKQVNVDQQKYNQYESHKNQQHPHKQTYEIKNDKKLPLQITILDDYITSDDDQQNNTRENVDMEYEYEIENDEI